MKRTDFSLNWFRTDGTRRFFGPPQPGTPVNLPDDFIITRHRTPNAEGGASTGFFPGGRATYDKQFDYDPDWAGKTVLLDIDGAYMKAEVSLNGDLLALHPYGYTPFTVDLTATLRPDKPNSFSIVTDSVQPSSRWYSGGGLYRQVSILTGGAVYVHPWDVFYVTESVSAEKAVVRAEIELTNTTDAAKAVTLRLSFDGAVCGCVEAEAAPGKTKVCFRAEVPAPRLWSADEPNLYNVRLDVAACDTVLDTDERRFGLRVIEIDAEKGMRVNGTPVKLRGGCVHHDNSLIGARAMPRAEERKVQKLKAAGYNAIRCAHNPPSTALLEASDRLGMYVLDESFDCWRLPKNARDYHLYFEKWWQEDTAAMVRRDRSHPCIYAWSIGNEISEMNGSSNGVYWCRVQADYVRALDPTRPVSSSVNHFVFPKNQDRRVMMHTMDMREELRNPKVSDGTANGYDYWDEGSRDTLAELDICGYNYMWPRYAKDHEKYPRRVIHATETHAFHIYDYWNAVLENDHVIGDFTWTATDNLGEGGAGRVVWDLDNGFAGLIGSWPWLSCYQGDLDLDLNRRPQSYYRKIVWGLDDGIHLFTTHPEKTGKPWYGMGWHWADVWPTWTFDDKYIGQPVQLEAYARCDEVEFLLNGASLGKVKTEKYKAFLTVPYQPGRVEAVAYTDGTEVARTALSTTGAPAKLALEPDHAAIKADGIDLSYVTVRVTDADGNTCVRDDIEISVEFDGTGELLGFGAGTPCTEEDYGTGKRFCFGGKALVCVRAGTEQGEARVKVSAPGLESAEAVIRIGG